MLLRKWRGSRGRFGRRWRGRPWSGLVRVAGPDGGEISISRWAYLHWFVPLADPKNASLLYALANLAVLFALLSWMYRRRIFLRV